MPADLVAQFQKPLWWQIAFHPVHVLVNPLDVVEGVASRGVDPIKGGCASFADEKLDRDSRQGTPTFLFHKQVPQVTLGDFHRDLPRLGVGLDAVEVGTGEAANPIVSAQGRAPAIAGVVASKQTHEHRGHVPAGTSAACHSAARAVVVKALDNELAVALAYTVLLHWVADAPWASSGEPPANTDGHHSESVPTGAQYADSLVTFPRRVEVIGEQIHDCQLARFVAQADVWNSFRHRTPRVYRASVAGTSHTKTERWV